jgi:hypothetical protein
MVQQTLIHGCPTMDAYHRNGANRDDYQNAYKTAFTYFRRFLFLFLYNSSDANICSLYI